MNETRVALYPRVSTQEQAKEGYSIGEQIERLTKYCEAMGWTIYKIYTDAGYSGGSTDRPGLQMMLQDIRDGKVDKVVVYKLDRLSRSQKDTLTLIEDEFLANNVDFVSMNENFDTSTPFGRAMIGILAVFAQLEREQIKERMTMGRDARAKEGLFHGGPKCPIGYDYIDGKLEVNEYEAMQVKELFNKFIAGVPFRSIENSFKKRGLVHKNGDWSNKTLRRVIQNEIYIGKVKFDGEVYDGIHTPILDEETFKKANLLYADRKTQFTTNDRRKTGQFNFLTGFTYCAKCGGRYHHIHYKKKYKKGLTDYNYYTCYSRSKVVLSMIKDRDCKNKNWKREILEGLVFDEIKKLATDPDYISQVKDLKVKDEFIDDSIAILQAEIAKLEKQISKYMDLYSMDSLSYEEVEDKIKPLSARKKSLSSELEVLTEEITPALTEENTITLVQSFEDILERGDYDEIKLTLDTLIKKIVIDGEDVTIYWNFQ